MALPGPPTKVPYGYPRGIYTVSHDFKGVSQDSGRGEVAWELRR